MKNRKALEFVMSNVRLRREFRKMRKVRVASMGALFAVVALSGCSGFYATIGSADGIREYHKGQNGLITNGKASDDADSSYWQSDRHNDKERTERDPFYNFTRTIRPVSRDPK